MFEQLRFLPTPGLGRNYYLNSEVFRLVEGAGFEPIFRGNVTRLPLLVYWRLNQDSILRKIHNKIPRWLGTVGVVVGEKSMVRVSTLEFMNRREKTCLVLPLNSITTRFLMLRMSFLEQGSR
jgi:hypothetical protein